MGTGIVQKLYLYTFYSQNDLSQNFSKHKIVNTTIPFISAEYVDKLYLYSTLLWIKQKWILCFRFSSLPVYFVLRIFKKPECVLWSYIYMKVHSFVWEKSAEMWKLGQTNHYVLSDTA